LSTEQISTRFEVILQKLVQTKVTASQLRAPAEAQQQEH